ncbi:MAG: hypothetical protein ACM31I_06135 [Deltaproteobacteria bacterium]
MCRASVLCVCVLLLSPVVATAEDVSEGEQSVARLSVDAPSADEQ